MTAEEALVKIWQALGGGDMPDPSVVAAAAIEWRDQAQAMSRVRELQIDDWMIPAKIAMGIMCLIEERKLDRVAQRQLIQRGIEEALAHQAASMARRADAA